MSPGAVVRTPYHRQPITLVFKAVKQKIYRQAHCLECGQPFADITDKIVTVFDGETELGQMSPDKLGIIEIHCPRHQCKQYYRMEFAV